MPRVVRAVGPPLGTAVVYDKQRGRTAWLAPQGAFIDMKTLTAFVSDLHLGKSTSFRRAGLSVPEGSDWETLSRLETVLHDYAPKKLVILGDLVHDADALSASLLERMVALRLRHAHVDWWLTIGNHDRKAACALKNSWAQALQMQLGDQYRDDAEGLQGVHEPPTDRARDRDGLSEAQVWQISGHLHPVILLNGKGRQRLRLRCFAYRDGQWVLPAFGAFTGGLRVALKDYDAIYPLAEDRVFGLHRPLSE